MSSDRFISGVQLPNVSDGAIVRASDSSDYRRTFYKLGNLHYTNESGAETQLTGRISTDTTLGEVKVDGTTISIDASGTISVVDAVEYLTQTEGDSRYILNTIQSLSLKDGSDNTIATFAATGNTTDSSLIVSNYQDTVFSTAFSVDATGKLTASSFSGNGADITNINYSVTQNDVTQHQASITITENQVSDLKSYLTDAPSNGSQYVRKDGDWSVLSGNATTATALLNSRNFSIGGAVTAPAVSFNGTGSVTFTATLNSDISDLNDVSTGTPTDGQVLTYNNSSGNWESKDPTGGSSGSFLPTKLDTITTVDDQATYNLTNIGVAHTPSTINAMLVSLNGITQSPGDAFTISGTTITFIPALQTGDVVDFIIDLGAAVETVSTIETDTLNSVTTRGSVTTNDIVLGGVTSTGKYVESVFNVVGTNVTLDASNGTIQTWTLSGNSTTIDSINSGEFLTLHIDNTASATITWPTIQWTRGEAPQLSDININIVHIWKVGTNLYGSAVGEVI